MVPQPYLLLIHGSAEWCRVRSFLRTSDFAAMMAVAEAELMQYAL